MSARPGDTAVAYYRDAAPTYDDRTLLLTLRTTRENLDESEAPALRRIEAIMEVECRRRSIDPGPRR